MSIEDLEYVEETIAILASAETTQRLAAAEAIGAQPVTQATGAAIGTSN